MSNPFKNFSQTKLFRSILAIERAIDFANMWIIIVGLGVMVVLVFAQVIMRRFFNYPLAWGEEVARYLTLWAMFLALGYGLAAGRFVGMDVVLNLFPAKVQEALFYVRLLIIITFAWVVLTGSLDLVALVERRNQITPALRFRMSHVYSAIPLGAGLMLYKVLMIMLKRIVGYDRSAGLVTSVGNL